MAVSNATSSATIAHLAGTQGAVASGADSRTLNANFDMFLQLLTTQLRNQSPLDPMKADEFARQITQFSAVEQQVKTNALLERLIAAQAHGATLAAMDLLGADVTAKGDVADLRNGQAEWTLQAPTATAATFTIRDPGGALVKQEARSLSAGRSSYFWDGRDASGALLPAGSYSLTVEAKDASGAAVQVSTAGRARVTAVDFSGTEPILKIGTGSVKISEIVFVTRGP